MFIQKIGWWNKTNEKILELCVLYTQRVQMLHIHTYMSFRGSIHADIKYHRRSFLRLSFVSLSHHVLWLHVISFVVRTFFLLLTENIRCVLFLVLSSGYDGVYKRCVRMNVSTQVYVFRWFEATENLRYLGFGYSNSMLNEVFLIIIFYNCFFDKFKWPKFRWTNQRSCVEREESFSVCIDIG